MTSIYLSLDIPRWMPKTEQDIQDAISGGLITENHRVDAKRQVVTKGDNKELARDLASFAVDGGTLIVGIDEDKDNQSFSLAPQKLDGLCERIESVARDVCDPSLSVFCTTVPSSTDPAEGYVFVHIPPSPTAPHMVDQKYYGRGDKSKMPLKDADVGRLHKLRDDHEVTVLARLREFVARDPIPGDQRKQAHLFLIAQPRVPRREMLLGLTSGDGHTARLNDVIGHALAPEVTAYFADMTEPAPRFIEALFLQRIAAGVSRATRNIGQGRKFDRNDEWGESAVELQVHEDGGLRLFSGRLSAADYDDTGEQEILVEAAIALTIRFLAFTRAVAEASGYLGGWSLAAGATGLRGLQGHQGRSTFPGRGIRPRYDEDNYEAAGETTWVELSGHPGPTVERLWGRFLRALDADRKYDDITRPEVD